MIINMFVELCLERDALLGAHAFLASLLIRTGKVVGELRGSGTQGLRMKCRAMGAHNEDRSILAGYMTSLVALKDGFPKIYY